MAAPQAQQKKVGPAGCIVSILIFVLGAIVAVVLFFVGAFSIVNKLQDLPSVGVGTSQQVQIGQGSHELYFADLTEGGTLPSKDPTVTITDPNGDPVFVGSPTDSTSVGARSNNFRVIGSFTAPSAGSYDVKVDSLAGGTGSDVYIGPQLSDLASTFIVYAVISVGVGTLTFIVALILGIMWLVRRSRAKRVVYPTYAGPYGGPPGPYGGPPGPYGGPPGPYGGPPAPGPPPPGAPPPGSPPPGGPYGGPPAPGPPPPGGPPAAPPPGTPGSF